MKRFTLLMMILISMNLYANSYNSVKKEALLLYKANEFNRSVNLTKNYIRKHPKSIKAKNLLATLYYWHKDYKRAKFLLESILKKSNYDESKKLLSYTNKKLKIYKTAKQTRRVEKKFVDKSHKKRLVSKKHIEVEKLHFEPKKMESDTKQKVAKNDTSLFQNIKQKNKNDEINEFDRLAALIAEDPKDLQSREMLSKYYLKVGAYQKAYDLAREALVINPGNEDMKKIVNHLQRRADIDTTKEYLKSEIIDIHEAKEALHRDFKNRKFTSYINIYKALKNSGIKFSKKENENALFAAVAIGDYSYAKDILANSSLPHSRYKDRVQTLLMQK
ncbi:MAG: hypothetical protein DSZ06_02450 [Sulfurospirillum sp.]|nr:MAG: hypothetical protein DSZ06_02450 [Sulfurospirillum sp.]